MTTTKLCTVCGIDVSQIKRTKDALGRYYCESCYNTAVLRSQSTGDAEPNDLEGLAAAAAAVNDLAYAPTYRRSASTGRRFPIPTSAIAVVLVIVAIIVTLSIYSNSVPTKPKVVDETSVAATSIPQASRSAIVPTLSPPSEITTYLADLPEAQIDCWTDPAGRMVFHKRASDFQGTPISVNGHVSPNGIFTHPRERGSGSVTYALNGRSEWFETDVSIADSDDPQPQSPTTFTVIGDGKTLWRSNPVTAKCQLDRCSVNIKGVQSLELRATAAASHYFAHAVWIEPRVRGHNDPAETGIARDSQKPPTLTDAPPPSDDGVQAWYERGIKLCANGASPEQIAAGIQLLQRAAEGGHAEAMDEIAVRYLQGNGLPADSRQALAWFQKSAGLNNAQAQCNLGLMYSNGTGVTQDHQEALKWLVLSAHNGNVQAMTNVAVAYYQGRGAAANPAIAKQWAQEAANRGDREAMVLLAYEPLTNYLTFTNNYNQASADDNAMSIEFQSAMDATNTQAMARIIARQKRDIADMTAALDGSTSAFRELKAMDRTATLEAIRRFISFDKTGTSTETLQQLSKSLK